MAALCEFESVGLQVQQNLHDSMLVGAHDVLIFHTDKLGFEVDAHFIRFLSLDTHDLFDSLTDIKFFVVYSELAGLNLSVV